MSLQELEDAAMKLSPQEKAQLIHALAVALDQVEDDEDDSELTPEVLNQRWADYLAEEKNGKPAAQVHADARKRYGLA